ncbi:hypothetical protein K461DRAFT_294395 [Myriangium duriaei CBS 260.36]|uniref:UBR-type domain-containing protein n=1 Tax=Myriangium duriaei CBS 260.36 TaxID=1168546 RepID=A0A9P4IZI6_9PEZI|nr:hypothetical protein K461DRAFT_294395 [Myriangium duriaei CBS 260.36]
MSAETAPQPSDAQSQVSKPESQTAQDYISQQLQLEADAREALPYQFDTCTKPLGPLRQSLFSCLTCNPTSQSPYIPAGVCYSCSISCHGEHELVELFSKRDFECDCGTTRIPSSAPCTLRSNPVTGLKGGVTGDTARQGNKYNQNYAGRFCGCGDEYDPAKEKGTMFQCLGLGHVEDGGCGEDWWHPECLMGLPRQTSNSSNANAPEQPEVKPEFMIGTTDSVQPPVSETAPEVAPDDAPPPGFPAEDEFDHLLCYKCVEANPWTKSYAGTSGFLPPVYFKQAAAENGTTTEAGTSSAPAPLTGAKRKLEEPDTEDGVKRSRVDDSVGETASTDNAVPTSADAPEKPAPDHTKLGQVASGKFSIFVKEDFRDHLCRCPECFPRLSKFPQLLEMEDTYEPPVSESDDGEGQGSVGSKSLLDRGEAALSTMDRMRAIEGVMAYNNLRDKVKSFLQPFAESGQAVGAEDVKAYFARLRGDEEAIRAAASGANQDDQGDGDNRHEQSGY